MIDVFPADFGHSGVLALKFSVGVRNAHHIGVIVC